MKPSIQNESNSLWRLVESAAATFPCSITYCFVGSSQAKTEELKTGFELKRLKELKDRVQTIEMEGTQGSSSLCFED